MAMGVSANNAEIQLLMISDRSLSSILEHEGYKKVGIHSYVATNFFEIKGVLSRYKVDAIMINWEYEDIDPIEVIFIIKKQEEFKHIPIIVTSIHGVDERVQKLKEVDLFVKQPIPRVILLERIRKLLNLKTRSSERVSDPKIYLRRVKVRADQGGALKMNLADISESGIFMYSEKSLQVGQAVHLEFSLPGVKTPLRIQGEVKRVSRMHKINDKFNKGIGVEFLKFEGSSEEDLLRFIEEKQPDKDFISYYL